MELLPHNKILHSEFDMLTALYELALQNPDRGRAVSLKLTPQMFSGEGTEDAFRLVRRVLSVCEQPTTSDITRDEHYEKCRDLVIDVLAKAPPTSMRLQSGCRKVRPRAACGLQPAAGREGSPRSLRLGGGRRVSG